MIGRHDKAVELARKAVERDPESYVVRVTLVSACISAGLEEEARAAAADVLRINPKFSLDYKAKTLPYKDQSVTDRYAAALRKAGLK